MNSLSSNPLFVCVSYQADGAEHRIHVARVEGSVEDLAAIHQTFDRGALVFSSWATNNGGSSVTREQFSGTVSVPPRALATLQDTKRQYEEAVDLTCSLGIGMNTNDSFNACKYSFLQGGDQTSIWEKETAEKLKELLEDKPEDLPLMKAQHEHHTGGGGKSPYYRKITADKNPEQQAQKQVDSGLKVQAPAKSRAASHHALSFSQIKDPGKMAGGVGGASLQDNQSHKKQGPQDNQAPEQAAPQEAPQEGEDLDSIKQGIAEALEKLHKQLPDIKVLKENAPKTYQAIIGIIEGIIALGNTVSDKSLAKSEIADKTAPGANISGIPDSSGLDGLAEGEEQSLYKDELQGGVSDGKSPDQFDQIQLAIGTQHEMEHTKDPEIARRIAMDHLTEDPNYYKDLLCDDKPSSLDRDFEPDAVCRDISPCPSKDPST